MTAVVLIAIVLQIVLPHQLGIEPHWLVPALEGGILIALVAVDPGRMVRRSAVTRGITLLLVMAISLENAWSLVLLVRGLVDGSFGQNPVPLLIAGATIWGTNVILFGIWYWEFDRGGAASRANGLRPHPDLMFPQQANPAVASPDWEPQFFDYLYTSFTNAAAFSPTDTMPLSRWAKMLFLLQSSVSLTTMALVFARAANVLH
ncbi:MAG: hypothetical protein ACYDGN_10800 [Acidimicrobiales bacterium]